MGNSGLGFRVAGLWGFGASGQDLRWRVLGVGPARLKTLNSVAKDAPLKVVSTIRVSPRNSKGPTQQRV